MGLDHHIREQVLRRPEAPALWWNNDGVTYAELAGLSRQVESRIGADESTAVALVVRKSPQAVALVLGCLSTGRPVVLASPDLGQLALRDVCERAGCTTVVRLEAGGIEDASFSSISTTTPSDAIAAEDSGISFMFTTSGSTGTPKVVPLSANAVMQFVDWAGRRFGLGEGTTVLSHAPLSFDLSLLDVWATLRFGGCVALIDEGAAFNPRRLAATLTEAEARLVQAVPAMYGLLLNDGLPAGSSYPHVEHVILTGDHTPSPIRAQLPRLFPNSRFYNVYGCTETNDSFMHEFDGAEAAAPGPLPIGRPIPGVAVAVEADGELLVSTHFQTSGTLPEEAGAFVVRTDGRRYYRTGDLVRQEPDGMTTLIGRKDFQVKIRGVRINLEEVERVLREHDEVEEAAAVAMNHDPRGTRLHATVVRRPGSRLDQLGLRQHCADRLPRAAIPAVIDLRDTPLPKTSTGKLDRRLVLSQVQPDPGAAARAMVVRRHIAEEYLPGLPPTDVPTDYDLIANGVIDSLGLLRLVAWLKEQFQIPLDELAISPDNFRSVEAIGDLVESALNETEREPSGR